MVAKSADLLVPLGEPLLDDLEAPGGEVAPGDRFERPPYGVAGGVRGEIQDAQGGVFGRGRAGLAEDYDRYVRGERRKRLPIRRFGLLVPEYGKKAVFGLLFEEFQAVLVVIVTPLPTISAKSAAAFGAAS